MATKKHLCTISVSRVTGLNTPVALNDAVNKEYVDSNMGNGNTSQLPFWVSNGNKECIQLPNSKLLFWLSNNSPDNIDLGC